MGQGRDYMGNYKILWEGWKRNTVYQNVWDVVNAVVKEKCIAVNAYIKERRCHITSSSKLKKKKDDSQLHSKEAEVRKC